MGEWSASHSAVLRAPASTMWELWENPKRWCEWNRQIASAELHGPFAAGSTARVRLRGSLPQTFHYVAVEPGRLFTDEARMPGAKLGHEHRLREVEGGVEVAHTLYFRGPLAGMYGALMGRRMRRAVRDFVERERALVEGPRARPERPSVPPTRRGGASARG